jgi:hypothetical protein
MRQRISERNRSLANILASVGLSATADASHSTDLLRQRLVKLEARKREAEATLSAILQSDPFCYAEELEADLITDFEEHQRLTDCLDEVREYHEILCNDLTTATESLRSSAASPEVNEIQRDIAAMERKLNDIRSRGDLSANWDLNPQEIQKRIAHLTGTLSAERCSTAVAVDLEKTSAAQLKNLERGALIRLEQAMRLHVVEI